MPDPFLIMVLSPTPCRNQGGDLVLVHFRCAFAER